MISDSTAVFVSLLVLVGGYVFRWRWVGVREPANAGASEDKSAPKTLWAWVQLLIIPAAIATGTTWFSQRLQDQSNQANADQARETVLNTYIGAMSDLLLAAGRPLHIPAGRSVARARTLEALQSLDGVRKGQLLGFLYEASLISVPTPLVDLQGASLVDASLHQASLKDASLIRVDLEGADLSLAQLTGADLDTANIACDEQGRCADLAGAVMGGARLVDTHLDHANMTSANLSNATLLLTDFNGANLSNAELTGANLTGAFLSGANLSGATLGCDQQGNCTNLRDVRGMTTADLEKSGAQLAKGVTLPDGTVYK